MLCTLVQDFSFYKPYLWVMARHYRKGTHTVHELTVHLVFSTKYRYHVLKGDVQLLCRDTIRVCVMFWISV